MRTIILITIGLLLSLHFVLYSQQQNTCILKGIVLDSITDSPIQYAKVYVESEGVTVFTGKDGKFDIELNCGSYVLKIEREGYLKYHSSIVLDSSAPQLSITVKLISKNYTTDTITVTDIYLKKQKNVNTSFSYALYDELRTIPGAVEDVIKYFQTTPGVTTSQDWNNDLIVRGGSPIENLVTVDGFEIRNPNHYGPPGTTSGALSFINLKLVKEADFYSGGFPALYGDKLSSVLDIRLKEGNYKRLITDINFSLTGFGVFLEGPFSKEASYMFSARRSYLELFKDRVEMEFLPDFWDVNIKLNYNDKPNSKLFLIGMMAIDRAIRNNPQKYINQHIKLLTMNWGFGYIENKKNYSLESRFGYNFSKYDVYYVAVDIYELDMKEREFAAEELVKIDFSDYFKISFKSGIKFQFPEYKVSNDFSITGAGFVQPNVNYKKSVSTFKLYGAVQSSVQLFDKKITLNTGLRFDFSEYIVHGFTISPRLGITYRILPKTLLNFSAGTFYQVPEYLWLFADSLNKKLNSIQCNHYILGIEQSLFDEVWLNIEGYLKNYSSYPVNIYNPIYIYIDAGTGMQPSFLNTAVSFGRGYITGIDIILKKKISESGLYGSLIYSFTHSKFKALIGPLQKAAFDKTNEFSLIAGYRFKPGWTFSIKFRYQGGRPFPKYDYEMSKKENWEVYNLYNYKADRLPCYSRFDIRADKEFNFGRSKLLVYLEVQNLFNHDNVGNYYWDQDVNNLKLESQLPLIPILGISYQF